MSSMILDHYRGCFARIIIMSPSIFLDSVWDPVKEYIRNEMKVKDTEKIYFDEWDPEALQHVLDEHTKIVKVCKEQHPEPIGRSGAPFLCVVLGVVSATALHQHPREGQHSVLHHPAAPLSQREGIALRNADGRAQHENAREALPDGHKQRPQLSVRQSKKPRRVLFELHAPPERYTRRT
jgi:hypothetical protein